MAKYEIKDGVGIIPEGTTKIKKDAFYDCEDLTSVFIPESVTEIGEAAFERCVGLTEIAIPVSVKKIGQAAFSRCANLTKFSVAEDNLKYDSRDNCNAIIDSKHNTLAVGCASRTV